MWSSGVKKPQRVLLQDQRMQDTQRWETNNFGGSVRNSKGEWTFERRKQEEQPKNQSFEHRFVRQERPIKHF